MIDADDPKLSVSQQCRILNLNRSTYYYKKKPVKPEDLKLMRIIDEQYLKTPSWGSRSMRNHLRRLGYKINRKRVPAADSANGSAGHLSEAPDQPAASAAQGIPLFAEKP